MKFVGIIWAQAHGGVIGHRNTIPWRVPEDMAYFKSVTMGHPVIMGRRTWDSLHPRFRPLAGRRNIVVTRDRTWAAEGAERAGSLAEALERTGTDPVWITGGGEIYSAAMESATELRVTEIDVAVDGDSYAPAIDARWRAETEQDWTASRTGPKFRILRYTR
ncbi:dihydrofolate reductase [Nocardia bovistercoris]|uniref:Dihydrofolate reductase n=1 Tax=Nocardia bovistercoris TaxID=2785916 RepID=A0A931MZJ5_9NOCA|nr:dihydrofolate reductase [Nocardia bovistercoris]